MFPVSSPRLTILGGVSLAVLERFTTSTALSDGTIERFLVIYNVDREEVSDVSGQ